MNDDQLTAGAAWFEEAVGGGAAVEMANIEPDPTAWAELWPIERQAVASAVSTRRTEFAIGRRCAHRALERLGCIETAIAVGTGREPIWPAGFVGSIAHTAAVAAAGVGLGDGHRSFGLDLELEGSVDPDLHRLLLTEAEQEEVRRGNDDLATVLFSAKEAIYKASYPLCRQWLGFLDAELELDRATGAFVASISSSAGHPLAGRALTGRSTRSGGHVLTAVTIEAL